MTSTQSQDAVPPNQQTNSTQYETPLIQQQTAMQPSDARTAKRIKVEHGEDSLPSPLPFNSPSPTNLPSSTLNGQGKGSGGTSTPVARSSQQMGPPLSARPSYSAATSYTNGEAASPVAQSAAQSPSPQPSSQQGSRSNTGPGRVPYQFGMGLPTPGINFTRTPTTGSFVASNSNSRQHTPTEQQPRAPSRVSPPEPKTTQEPKTAQEPKTTQPAATSSNAASSSSGTGSRNTGVDHLQDLLSISGVDLKAEEEAAQRSTAARTSYNTANAAALNQASSQSVQMRQALFYLEIYPLSRHIHRIAAKHGLRVDPEVLTYLSLAAKTRFQNLLEAMVASSRHRTWSSHLRPPPLYERGGQAMYHEEIHDDPQKLLAALSRVEKREEQEARQARIQKEEMEANNIINGQASEGGAGGVEGESSGQAAPTEGGEEARKKAKKSSTSSTAKNMSEDKRLKLANKTAAQALGISTNSKAWMFGGSSGTNSPFGSKKPGAMVTGSRLPKPRFAPVASEGGSGGGDGNADEQGREQEGGEQGEGSQGGSGNRRAGSISVGGWGDLAARQRFKEEEERLARRRVNLQDALHALEMERNGGAGRGSGELMLYSTLALGRPPTRKL